MPREKSGKIVFDLIGLLSFSSSLFLFQFIFHIICILVLIISKVKFNLNIIN